MSLLGNLESELYPLCDSYVFLAMAATISLSSLLFCYFSRLTGCEVLVVRVIVTPCILLLMIWFFRVVSFSYL